MRIITTLTLLLTGALFMTAGAEGKNHRQQFQTSEIAGVSYGIEKDVFVRIPPPAAFLEKSSGAQQAEIVVNYHDFPENARVAFDYAVSIWESLLSSPQTIYIEAYWKNLGPGVLGSSGPTNYFRGYDGFPKGNVFYPISLAEKMINEQLNEPGEPDLIANFSSTASWYFGTDGNTPSSRFDFVTVVLHELCHGLGFTGSCSVDNGIGSWGWGTGSTFTFDNFIYDVQRNPITDTAFVPNPSKALADKLTSGLLYFDGPVVGSEIGSRILLYAPSDFDSGSSIYHLNTTFSLGNDRLMTPFTNTASSNHNPGRVAMSMMGDIGWRHLFIDHQPINNTEVVADIQVSANIYTDFPSPVLRPRLYYSVDSTDYVEVDMIQDENDTTLFHASIPVDDACEISYYLSADDRYNRRFHYPVSAPDYNASFIVGPDNEVPEIVHYPMIFLLPGQDSLIVQANVSDPFGVDSVWLEYSINEQETRHLGLDSIGENKYMVTLHQLSTLLSIGDSVRYRIFARDASLSSNLAVYPDTGHVKVTMEAIPDFVDEIEDDFAANLGNFIMQGFQISTPSGFDDGALHTFHPYEFAGEESSLEYIAQLRFPIKIKEDKHYMSFDEIVLVEQGEPGTVFGDDEFWDYVIVEASSDEGNTWLPLEDGWDCRLHTEWEDIYTSSIYNQFSQAIGNPNLYKKHLIDLTASGDFKPGDIVILRFRLFSDPFAYGWGWAIDNLLVQARNVASPDLIKKGEILVYPNPVSDGILMIEGKDHIDRLYLYNLQGQLIYSAQPADTKLTVSTSAFASGTYLLRVVSNNRYFVQKVVIP